MPSHVTTEEAKKQTLAGADTYRYTHLIYNDDLNRDSGVVSLNIEAIKAFSDTITIAKRGTLANEQTEFKNWLDKGGFDTSTPIPRKDAFLTYIEYVNYENLKIAAAFELHLKARLLARNYLIHEIDSNIFEYKSLAKEQIKRPIDKKEIFDIKPYHFDGRLNYLPGLKDSSIKFSNLTDKPLYRKSLGLTNQHLDIIQDYRHLRNQIHFPGDFLETPNIQAFGKPIIEFLIEFINTEIIRWSNNLIEQHKFNFKYLTEFN